MPFDMIATYDRMRLLHSNPITVVLSRPPSYGGGGAVSVTVSYVQEQAATEETVESPMGGALVSQRRAFRLWLVETGALGAPHEGYLVTKQDGTVWHVDSVDVLCKGRSFRLHTTKRPS